MLSHRCCSSAVLVFSDLAHGLQNEGWVLCEAYNLCFERPYLASKDESKWNPKNNASKWHFPKTNTQVHYEFWPKSNTKVLSNTQILSFHLQQNTYILWKVLQISTDLRNSLDNFSVKAESVLSIFYQKREHYRYSENSTQSKSMFLKYPNPLYMTRSSWPRKTGSEWSFKQYLLQLGLDVLPGHFELFQQ